MTTAPRPIRRALISVYDKTGLVPFAKGLAARGVDLVSTGGSAQTLAAARLPVTEVAKLTGFPEMLDGRVKTLHPAIHGGLLARPDRPDHLAALARHGIAEIDLLVSNLYPFTATVAAGAGREECIENIDIGGVALTRAGAKNHEFVTVVTDPADYDLVLGEMANSGGAVSLATRRQLARKAFALTAAYDAAIATWLAGEEEVAFPETLVVREAWDKALACDPVSAFGGIVAVNRPLDAATAEAIAQIFVEVVIAPDAEPAAFEILAQRNTLRLLLTGSLPDPRAPGWTFRSVAGGLLVQERDRVSVGADALKVVTRRAPTEAEITELLFADIVAKHVKSNAIVFARGGATVGIGAGQPSRVDSVKIAVAKATQAGLGIRGAVVASDAFYPFADGLEEAIKAGATAALQPGGSRRDAEVIAAADAAGIAMVFSGLRHFRH